MTIFGLALTVIALAGCLTFVGLYSRVRWWRSEVGWHLMTFTSLEALILGLTLARGLWGDYPGREVVLTVAFAVFAAASCWRAAILWRTQRRARRLEREDAS